MKSIKCTCDILLFFEKRFEKVLAEAVRFINKHTSEIVCYTSCCIKKELFFTGKNFQGCSKPGQHSHVACALASNTGSHKNGKSSDAGEKEKCARQEHNLSNAPGEECPLEGGEADTTSVLSKCGASRGAGMLGPSLMKNMPFNTEYS